MEKITTLVLIDEYEASQVFGGKSRDISYVAEMLGMGLGIISKLVWKALKMSQQAILEMAAAGYYSEF